MTKNKKDEDKSQKELILEIGKLRELVDNLIIKDPKQRQIEEMLQLTQHSINNITESIFWIDESARFVFVNNAACRNLGYSQEELLRMNTFDVDPVFPKNKWKEHWQKIAKIGTFTIDTIHNTKDGREIPVEVTTNLVEFRGKQYNCAVARDITERKKAEQELKFAKRQAEENESRFKALHNASFGGIAIHDKGIILDCNHGLSEISGYTVDELIGMDGLLLIAANSREIVMANILGGYEKPYEVIGVRKNGEKYPVRMEAREIPYKGKQVRVVEFRDITEQIHTEESLQKSEERYKEMVLSTTNCIAVYRPVDNGENFIFVEFNPMAEKTEKISKSEVIGKKITEVFPGVIDFGLFKIIQDVYKSGKAKHFPVSIYQDSRIQGYRENYIYRLSTGEIVAVYRDLTESKKLEEESQKLQEQLIQAQKMEAIGTLAGGIAHDFNNVLGVIMGYTELTLDNLNDTKRTIINLDRVMKASIRAKDMVQQILAFSRKDDQNMESVNLEKLIKETISFLRSSIPTIIKINVNIEKDLKLISGNETQINQILLNLCTNATHAMKEKGGVLEIGLKETVVEENDTSLIDMEAGTYLHLYVSDTGIGMSKELSERIFEPYFTTKASGEGTGMGLAVIYGIVKSHKGEIKLYSEPEKGTVFNVYFPVIESVENSEFKIEQEQIVSGKNERILFVDDELFIVELSIQMLKKLGYQVEGRSNSVEALELFRTNPENFDLIITDMTMPYLTGVNLVSEIHKIRSDIPVILCTGFSSGINKEKLKDFGINALIMKPVVKSDLSKVIREVLYNKQSSGFSKN